MVTQPLIKHLLGHLSSTVEKCIFPSTTSYERREKQSLVSVIIVTSYREALVAIRRA